MDEEGRITAESIRYENFDLTIEKGRRRGYRLKVLQSPAGEGSANFHPPFNTADLDRLLESLRHSDRDIQVAGQSRSRKSLESIGRDLFKALFAGEIRRRWESSLKEAKFLRLRLRLASVPEFEAWPWELLYDPSRRVFLALSRSTPVVRYLDVGLSAVPLSVNLPLRILVVAASPAGRSPLDLEREWKKVEEALAPLKAENRLILDRLDPPTPAALGQKLRNAYHILHFIGHGTSADEGGSVELEGEDRRPAPLNGQSLAAILLDQKDLRLVLLNSCDGSRLAQNNPFSGVGQALVKCGLPAVIAMRSRISDLAAADWSGSFYESLVAGEPVDAALSAARWTVQTRDGGVDWSIPVLYMRAPDGRIFDVTNATSLSSGPEEQTNTSIWKPLLMALLVATALGLGYWSLATRPPTAVITSDSGCPSPPGLDMAFAKIPPNEFFMGSESGPKDQRPAHEVRITQPYCIGKFEVTQKQWRVLMPENPSRNKGKNLPVEGVSWQDAQQFVRRLNQIDPAGRYRLATEAEWMLAAVTGGGSPDPEDLYRYGNCLSQSKDDYDKTAPVGCFEPNSLGMFDLYGNVSEWVSDGYGPYPTGPVTDPQGSKDGKEKVRRGGFFGNKAENCTANSRASSLPNRRYEGTGVRIVRAVVR